MSAVTKFTTNILSPIEQAADFADLIQTIQFLSKNTIAHYRQVKNYSEDLAVFLKTIEDRQDILIKKYVDDLGYTLDEAKEDLYSSLDHAQNIIATESQFSPQFHIPQRMLAIYGSWSSPLYRFFKWVIPALSHENSVLLFCSPEVSAIYATLAEWLSVSPIASNRIAVLPIEDQDVLNTLLEHPAFNGIGGDTYLYEAERLRPLLTSTEKNYSFHFGAHNPVIILKDSSPEHIEHQLRRSLSYHKRSEIRFNRWFVQENFFADFTQILEDLLKKMPNDYGVSTNKAYSHQLELQHKEFSRLKSWHHSFSQNAFNINMDFSNCSPLHQTGVAGPLLTITRFKNINEASKFANTTKYSNATCILTESEEKFLQAAQEQRTPFVFKNKLPPVFDACFDSGDKLCSFRTTPNLFYQQRIILPY